MVRGRVWVLYSLLCGLLLDVSMSAPPLATTLVESADKMA